MKTLAVLMFLIGCLGIIGSIIYLVINLIKKKAYKNGLIILGVFCIVTIGGMALMPTQDTVQTSKQEQKIKTETKTDKSDDNKHDDKELREQAVKAEFVKLNGHTQDFQKQKVFVDGEVTFVDTSKALEIFDYFTITTKEGDGYGMYTITNFDGVDIKVGDKLKVYGYVEKDIDKTGMPAIIGTIIEPSTNPVDISKEINAKLNEALKIGEAFTYKDKYNVTINSVRLTDERNQFADKQFEKVAVIEFTYQNLNSDEDVYISGTNFKAYDEEGNILSAYPKGVTKYPQGVSKGRKCTAEMSLGFNKGNKLELEFYDNMFNDKSDTKFIVEIQ